MPRQVASRSAVIRLVADAATGPDTHRPNLIRAIMCASGLACQSPWVIIFRYPNGTGHNTRVMLPSVAMPDTPVRGYGSRSTHAAMGMATHEHVT
jgi:hypothetical protein